MEPKAGVGGSFRGSKAIARRSRKLAALAELVRCCQDGRNRYHHCHCRYILIAGNWHRQPAPAPAPQEKTYTHYCWHGNDTWWFFFVKKSGKWIIFVWQWSIWQSPSKILCIFASEHLWIIGLDTEGSRSNRKRTVARKNAQKNASPLLLRQGGNRGKGDRGRSRGRSQSCKGDKACYKFGDGKCEDPHHGTWGTWAADHRSKTCDLLKLANNASHTFEVYAQFFAVHR